MTVLAEARDPDGRRVDLTQERWDHIVDAENGHPELDPLQAEVTRAVEAPDRRSPGRAPNEEWFYSADIGPSRWLKVVVVFDEGRGSIITAFPRRALP